MIKADKIPNKLHSDSIFWIFRFEIFLSEFVPDFGIRFLNFFHCVLGAIVFLKLVRFNINSMVSMKMSAPAKRMLELTLQIIMII